MNFRIPWLTATLSQHTHRRWLIGMGHAFFVAYLLLCAIFWRERMLHFDSANYAYHLLLSGDFYTGMNRWLSYLPQVVPLAVFHAGGSLPLLLIGYSVALGLLYYLSFWVTVHVLRNPRAGLWLCLALCLTVRYKFYGPVGEIVLSLALLAPLLGLLDREWPRPQQHVYVWGGSGLVLLIGMIGHPFAVLSALVLLGFLMSYRSAWRSWRVWPALLTLAVGGAWKLWEIQSRPYETRRLGRLEAWWQHWSVPHEFYALERFGWYVETQYHIALVFFGVGLVVFALRRRGFVALYLFLASVSMTVLVINLHAYLRAPIYIMYDGYLAHLGLVLALGIVYGLTTVRKRYVLLSIGALLVFSLVRIVDTSDFFQRREAYFLTLFAQHPQQRKLVAKEDDFAWKELWLPWATGSETLLMTASLGRERTATMHYLIDDETLTPTQLQDSTLLLHNYLDKQRDAAAELPTRYFQLPNQPYRLIVPPH